MKGKPLRLVEIVAVAAAAASLAACEKAEDRAATSSAPKFDVRYCLDGEQPPFRMTAAGCVVSDNHAFVFGMTRDGVLELRAVRNGQPAESLWTSRSRAGKRDESAAVFQNDGNLVVYQTVDTVVWNSGSLGKGDYRLSVTNDGNVVIHAVDGRPLWLARLDLGACLHELVTPQQLSGGCLISPSGNYAMTLTAAGLEVAPVQGKAMGKSIWTSGSPESGPPGSFLTVQSDGNLVVYDAGKPIWNSQTGGHSGMSKLELTDEGELQLHGPDGGLLWSSKTSRGAKV